MSKRVRAHQQTYSDESEYSQSGSEEQQKKKPETRFYKHSLQRLDLNRIVVNISRCHYPIVQQITRRLGWKVQVTQGSQNWDLCWTDSAVQPEQLFRMLQHQKINHFPGMYIIARKDCLGRALMRMRKCSPSEYNYFPLTWHIPVELNEFSVQFELAKGQGKKHTYIVKPEASCQGKGIHLTRKFDQIANMLQPCVVQRYIDKPYLINGLKFDFRIYVLLAGCDPMRIYIYDEGLARFATKAYIEPTKHNLKQSYIHLTNYAINKDNPAFIFNTNSSNMNTGHKRSLRQVFRLLEKEGLNIDQIQQSINDIIVKTIITGQPLLSHLYNLSQPQNHSNDMCFQILGFDVLLEQDGKPKLLEVNHTPSFMADTPLDQFIKSSLIRDTLQLVNITTQRKSLKVSLGKQRQYLRSMRKKVKLLVKEKHYLKQNEQRQRDQYENQHIGRFKKIYPVHSITLMNKYTDLLEISRNLFNKSNINKKAVTQKSESLSPSPVRNRKRAIVQKESVEKIPFTSLPSLVLKKVKEEPETLKSTIFKMQEGVDVVRNTKSVPPKLPFRTSRHIHRMSELRQGPNIEDKIQQIENDSIEEDLQSTRRLARLKNMSLGSHEPVDKFKLPPTQTHSLNKHQLSANYAAIRLENFLAPKLIKISDIHQIQKSDTDKKQLSNYERFLVQHDLHCMKKPFTLQ